jgi:O-acetyl-ADP-ribose deacetylase (regulator of RNase III)
VISVGIGSVSDLEAGAIVRAVSSELDPVTPVARDLGHEAGVGILEQLEAMGSFPLGGAVITPGGEGAATFLIHIVVLTSEEPISSSGVRRALLNGLRRAVHFGVTDLAMPMLGTGAGNLDPETSADAIVGALLEQRDAEGLPEAIRIFVTSDYERAVFEDRLQNAGLLGCT